MTPTINLVPLDAELKNNFQELFRAVKKNTIALAKQAFQIHNEHYSRKDRKYDKEFEVWWEAQGLDRLFGSRSKWTKWYRAGEAIEKVHAQFEKYADKLPATRDALYEIALLQPDELRLCLENRFTRTSVTQDEADWRRPKKPQPVINSGATAGSIRSWRKNGESRVNHEPISAPWRLSRYISTIPSTILMNPDTPRERSRRGK